MLQLRCMCIMASDIQLLSAELLLILIVYITLIGQFLHLFRYEVEM